MALPVAQLPSMPSLDLGTSQRRQDPEYLKQILAQLAVNLVTPVLSNAITHATGGDQTQVAMDEGLVPERDRNVLQRFLGDQTTTEELNDLRVSKGQQQLTAADTERAKYAAVNEALEPDRFNRQLEAQAQQAELGRAQRSAENAEGLAADLVTRRATREQDQAQFGARQAQDQAQFEAGAPVRDAQARALNAAATENEMQSEGLKQLQRDMMLMKLMPQLQALLPAASTPEQEALVQRRIQEYLAVDPETPSVAEASQFFSSSQNAAPAKQLPTREQEMRQTLEQAYQPGGFGLPGSEFGEPVTGSNTTPLPGIGALIERLLGLNRIPGPR